MTARIILIVLLFNWFIVFGQDNSENQYSIMFYNVENLFDCDNDSLTLDDEFTFNGNKHWSYNRYKKKLNQISKVILGINQWNSPTLIGLCEVENIKVLNQLIYETGLNNVGYKFIHFDSPDRRGIDVALLYNSQHFIPLDYFPISFSDTSANFLTRDALYVKGFVNNHDSLHLFINHWPSKIGGESQSELKRIRVARILKTKTDSIFASNINAKIILTGDFNAELTSESIQIILSDNQFHSLLNANEIKTNRIGGSHKYQGHWSLIDHILISSSLINNSKIKCEHKIANLPWLLEEDVSFSGVKPKRTYSGPRYIGGPSDHLPVILQLTRKDSETNASQQSFKN